MEKSLKIQELAALAVLAILAYAAAVSHPFVFDDLGGIVENRAIHSIWPPWRPANSPPDTTPAGRPVVAWSLALNYLVGGLNPAGYRLLNIGLHVLAAYLIVLLGRELLRRVPGSAIPGFLPFAVACVWIVHPLGTSAVTYIIQRAEVWMAVFYLGTLLWTARHCASTSLDARRRSWMAALLCCAGGMLSKESMVTAPVAAIFLDRAFFAPSWKNLWSLRKWFYASLAGTWVLLAACMAIWPRSKSVGFHEASITPWGYLLMQSEVIFHYLGLVVWPVGLSLDYAWPRVTSVWHVFPELIGLAAIGAFLVFLWIRSPRLAWLLGMPFLILCPTSSVVPVVTAIASDHRMYLPSAFLIAAGCLAIIKLCKMSGMPQQIAVKVVVGACAVLAVVLLQLTVKRNAVYSSLESIWRDVVTRQPNNSRALNNLGFAIWKDNRPLDAEEYFRAAINKDPRQADALYNLGTILGQRGNHSDGLHYLQRATEVWPDYAAAYANIGVIHMTQGDTEKGMQAYSEALKHRPDHLVANFNLAVVLFQRGELENAERHIRKVISIQPDYPRAKDLLREITASKNRS